MRCWCGWMELITQFRCPHFAGKGRFIWETAFRCFPLPAGANVKVVNSFGGLSWITSEIAVNITENWRTAYCAFNKSMSFQKYVFMQGFLWRHWLGCHYCPLKTCVAHFPSFITFLKLSAVVLCLWTTSPFTNLWHISPVHTLHRTYQPTNSNIKSHHWWDGNISPELNVLNILLGHMDTTSRPTFAHSEQIHVHLGSEVFCNP